uniref:Uncharacterized protein n=1 Tax=Meloidogyne javanica TaxID=6303 RepID=A0A915MJD5_MELJA
KELRQVQEMFDEHMGRDDLRRRRARSVAPGPDPRRVRWWDEN